MVDRAEKAKWANELVSCVHLSFIFHLSLSFPLWIRPYPIYIMGGVGYKAVVVSSLWSTSIRVHGGLVAKRRGPLRCFGAKEALVSSQGLLMNF